MESSSREAPSWLQKGRDWLEAMRLSVAATSPAAAARGVTVETEQSQGARVAGMPAAAATAAARRRRGQETAGSWRLDARCRGRCSVAARLVARATHAHRVLERRAVPFAQVRRRRGVDRQHTPIPVPPRVVVVVVKRQGDGPPGPAVRQQLAGERVALRPARRLGRVVARVGESPLRAAAVGVACNVRRDCLRVVRVLKVRGRRARHDRRPQEPLRSRRSHRLVADSPCSNVSASINDPSTHSREPPRISHTHV